MATRALATAFVNIVPGTADLEAYLKGKLSSDVAAAGGPAGRGLAKGVGRGFGGSIKSFIGPALATMTASFGALGAINFFKDSIQQSSDLNESINAVGVTFGKNAKGILDLGQNAATAVGLSKNEFNGLATQFSAFAGTIAGKGGDVVGTIKDLTTRGADFASVMNIDVNDAMTLFQSGLAGETEPLRKYGIDLSAAAVEHYALANGIIHGKEKMTEAQKVQARYGLLMQSTTKTQGDFANTADQLANKQRITNAELKNAQAEIGDRLRPAMLILVGVVKDYLVPAVEGIGTAFDWFSANSGWLLPVLAGIGTAMLGIAIYTAAMNIAAAVAAAGGLPAIIAATWAWTAALLANPITWIILGIALLVAGLVALAMNWGSVTKWISSVWKTFTTWFSGTIKSIGGWFSGLWQGIVSVFSGIGNFFKGIFDGAVNIVKGFVNTAIGLINGIVDGINMLAFDIPDWVPLVGGQHWGLNIPKIPYLADGGFVNQPTTAVIGEAGPEVVTPLKDFKQMMGLDKASADQPIMADGIGLIGWMRREANGQAKIVFNTELGKTALGAR